MKLKFSLINYKVYVMKFLLSLILVVFIASSAFAENILTDNWKLKGHAYLVPYLDGRDFLNETYPITFTAMKLRVGVEKQVGNFSFKMALQNSKIFGDQAAVVSKNAPVYILEGYIKFDSLLNLPLSFTAGRQQIEYNDGRFLGISPWSYIERAHDGFKFSYKKDNMLLDFFATNHTTQYVNPPFNGVPSAYPYPEAAYEGYDILGFWYANKLGDAKNAGGSHSFDLFTYYEIDAKKTDGTNNNLDRFTSGLAYQWNANKFTAKAQMGYQHGKKAAKDVAAYLVDVHAAYKLNESFGLKLGTELFSGTAPTDAATKVNTFDDYLGRKHAFLGFMDYFTNARSAYGGLGVNDFYLAADYKINSNWDLNLTPHYFLSNQESASGKSDYGIEFDLGVRYTMQKGIWVEWFNGLFLPGELMKEFYTVSGKERGDMGFVSYFRFNANF